MPDIPRLSNKELLILQMLVAHTEGLYGLEMVKSANGFLKPGTIYVTLGRMEEKGYIHSKKEEARPATRGLPRRIYYPTGLGQRTLAAWETASQRWNEEPAI